MQINLNAALMGGDILGVALGEDLEVQKERILNQIREFFAMGKEHLIAMEDDSPRLYTNAQLSKKASLEKPIVLDERGLRIHTQDKSFSWNFADGFITVSIFENVLSVQQNSSDLDFPDETLTRFVSW